MKRLHPRLQELLAAEGWDALSPAQEVSIDALLERRHALVLAPTGYGKTEAALLPILHQLLVARDDLERRGRPWPAGFKALIVTPLRALNRDLQRRLEAWCEALGLRLGVRHGDTSQAERSKQSRDPPDILVTTPETVQLLLYGERLRSHLASVRFVVVDEVHDLAASERGAQLMVALERIEEVIAQPAALRDAPAKERKTGAAPSAEGDGFQRIGLSATVADDAAVARFLAGGRDVAICRVDEDKQRRLHVLAPEADADDERWAGELALPVPVVAQMRAVRRLVTDHARVIVFSNTRDSAELLTSRSALMDDGPPLLGLHHGSLDADHRSDVEERFRDGDLHGIVATSSLELGIDVGAIDHVVQLQSPRSVARLVQRLGRAGHRIGALSEGTIVSGGPEDHLECVAVARMAEAGLLEPLRIREAPLVVLANQLIAMSNEYADLDPAWCLAVLRRAGPFMELDDALFDACWETLLDVETVYPAPQASRHIGRSGRSRRHFLEHISLIPDEKKYRIINEASKRGIGTVDDAYVAAAMRPGDPFVMAGQSWRVVEVDAEHRKVRVAPSKDLGAIPQWSGGALPVSAMLAKEVARLRGQVLEDPDLAAAADPVLRHIEAGLAVPTDRRVTLDVGRRTVVAGIALGTRGNEALGRITAALLHQRVGVAVGMESDAYRIHFTVPPAVGAADIEACWRGLDPDTLDLLLGMVIKDQPVVRHHLVHVAKHFGALPRDLDPNRFSRAKMDALWERLALQEETLARLLHDRFDIEAVADFVRALDAGNIAVVRQGFGPLSRMASDQVKRMMAPRDDSKLLEEVRRRIEATDIVLVCTHCRSKRETTVDEVRPPVRCRACGHQGLACLRPWDLDNMHVLAKDDSRLDAEEKKLRKRYQQNSRLMASWGPIAARCLVARGVGATTAARILQKVSDPEAPAFWREILQAELEFARNHAHWR